MSHVKIIVASFFILTLALNSWSNYTGPLPASASSTGIVTQMNDTVASYGIGTYHDMQIQAEYAAAASALEGKSIDTITVDLRKVGAPTGTVQVGIFNTDLSVKQLFGSIDASTVATSYTKYTFSLPSAQSYKIQSHDIIGIKFAGGDLIDYIAIMTDQTNSFGGANSYRVAYSVNWNSQIGADLTMALVSHGSSVSPPQPPTALTAIPKMPPQIDLSWAAPENNGGSPVTGYMVERSTDNGTSWNTIVQNTHDSKTTYTDSHLIPVKTYTYRVSAINGIGTSIPSNTASAEPLSVHAILTKQIQ